MVLMILFLILSGSADAMHRSLPVQIETIGVRTLEYEDAKRHRPVIVELWYPVEASVLADTALEDVWIHPNESRNAPLSSISQKYPLILLSHGHGGERRDRSWLAEHLVKANFIVASVDHYGNSHRTLDPILTLQFWDRAKDISFTIDQLMDEPFLEGRLDEQRIGFTGYSLGGMTGLALAGGVVEQIEESIAKHSHRFPEISKEALDKVDFSHVKKPFRDPRIGAILLLAPANFIYRPEALTQIKVPIGLVSAINDEVLPHRDHSYPLIQHIVPVKLKVLRREISHFAFLNIASEFGKKFLPARVQSDPPCCDRSRVHRDVGKFAAEFFTEVFKIRTE